MRGLVSTGSSTRRAVLAFSMSPFITYVLVMLGNFVWVIS